MTVLIKQRGPSDCVLAAIAMAAGKAYDELWTQDDYDRVTADKGVSDEEPWMLRAGFKKGEHYRRVHLWGREMDVVKTLLEGRRAMLSVHSLNNDGGYHMVYWDGKQILDPSTQRTYLHLWSVVLISVIIFYEEPRA